MFEYKEYKKYAFKFFSRIERFGDLSLFKIDCVKSSM